jgi:L-asparagine transporter-like permease
LQNNQQQPKSNEPKNLNGYSLMGIGAGGIIGAGFFLGSSLSIRQAGPSIVFAFLLCGFIMVQVFSATVSISMNRPVTGSFRVYAEEFLGGYIGYLLGWLFYISGILGISSEALAAGIFLQFWFPQIPQPVLALISLLFVIFINRLSIRLFGYVESVMAFVKIAVLILFIAAGAYQLLTAGALAASLSGTLFPNGLGGFLQSMLIVIFTYSGIASIAMAANRTKDPKRDLRIANIGISFGIILLYTLSILILILLVRWDTVSTEVSPFVQALSSMNGFEWVAHLFSFVILAATISVMIASYYSGVQILLSFGIHKKAGGGIDVHGRKKPLYPWLMSGVISIIMVSISFFVGTKTFNYLVSASSYITLFNWMINLFTYLQWKKHRHKDETAHSPLIAGKAGIYITLLLLLLLLIFSLNVPDFRMGFAVFIVLVLMLSVMWRIFGRLKSKAK